MKDIIQIILKRRTEIEEQKISQEKVIDDYKILIRKAEFKLEDLTRSLKIYDRAIETLRNVGE